MALAREGECPPAMYERHKALLEAVDANTHNTFGCCFICGYPQQLAERRLDPAEPAAKVIELRWMDPNICPKCGEIASHFPGLFSWMINSMETQMECRNHIDPPPANASET